MKWLTTRTFVRAVNGCWWKRHKSLMLRPPRRPRRTPKQKRIHPFQSFLSVLRGDNHFSSFSVKSEFWPRLEGRFPLFSSILSPQGRGESKERGSCANGTRPTSRDCAPRPL